jgi:phenylpyruvate tautomerase PptA (4-oxalocrotonate tautomerase family)
MPMIDVLIPEGALKPEAEAQLVKELTHRYPDHA